MLKDDIERLRAAMTDASIAEVRVAEALTPIIAKLGYAMARDLLGDYGVILETRNFVRRVRWDLSFMDEET